MISSGDADALAELFSSIGKDQYGNALDRLSRRVAPFDMSCIFGFSSSATPVLIHDGYSANTDRRALRAYLRGAYLLDPFYSASVAGGAEGLWRMRDLVPDGYYEAELAWSQEVHPCISETAGTLVEEIGYVVPLGGGLVATYSLMRNRGGTAFDDSEIAALRGLHPVVGASLRRHWEEMHKPDPAALQPGSEEVFRLAFGDVLTPAQYAVTRLVLRGHSNVSIANNLGITEGTVKMHRYNIYKRLEISSQSELFQRFIDYLGT